MQPAMLLSQLLQRRGRVGDRHHECPRRRDRRRGRVGGDDDARRAAGERVRDEGMARVGRVVQAELPSFPELAQFYFEEVILRARRLVSRVLERGVESGEFREVSHGFAARGLASLLVHTAQLQCFFHDFDPDQLSDEAALGGLVDLYLHGVLARPDKPA